MSRSSAPPLDKNDLRKLLVLIAASAVDMIGFAIVLPLLPFYAENLHATAKTIGWIIASFSIAQLISAPLWGRVSDRYGRRPALLIGLSASAVAYVAFGLANTVAWLFLSRIIQGAGGGTTGVAQAYTEGVDFWYSEAPFAPKDNWRAEDDGYLVGFVWNGREQRSEVPVWDAKDIAHGPVAKVLLPVRVPNGFHSCWVSGERLKSGR